VRDALEAAQSAVNDLVAVAVSAPMYSPVPPPRPGSVPTWSD
jgi:hypothetical protein